MNRSSLYLAKFAYYIGVFLGVLIFHFDFPSKRFRPSKALKLYNSFVTLGSFTFLAMVGFIYEPAIKVDDLIILMAGPINDLTLLSIIIYVYGVVRFKEQKLLGFLNTALDINQTVTQKGRTFKFKFWLFSTTFLMDALNMVGLIVIFTRSFVIFKHLPVSFVLLLNASLLGKGVSRYVTHLYICLISYNVFLVTNVKTKVKKAVRDFEIFVKVNPDHSKHQFIKECCKLSEALDDCIIQIRRIYCLTRDVHFIFSYHILQLIIHNMSDILVLVNNLDFKKILLMGRKFSGIFCCSVRFR